MVEDALREWRSTDAGSVVTLVQESRVRAKTSSMPCGLPAAPFKPLLLSIASAAWLVGCSDDAHTEGPPAGARPDAAPDEPEGDAASEPDRDDASAPGQQDGGAAPLDAETPTLDASDGEVPDGSDDAGDAGSDAAVADDAYTMRVVRTGLSAPWQIRVGPDGMLWISERVGKRLILLDPADGSSSTALTVDEAYQASGQDGLLGFALDPGFTGGEPFVYLAYTYDADAGASVDRRTRLVRYRYDGASKTLGEPSTLLEGLPASTDHNSGRLAFGPDGLIYYTIGDQGHNQFDNKCLPIAAQTLPSQVEVDARDWSAYQGKVLRVGTSGAIPADNPVLAGVRSHVFSYGHRNAQGLAFGPGGLLYASEQGPKSDDELNLIQAGKNYGWPHVAGFRDDKSYVYGNWSAASDCASLDYSDYSLPPSVPSARESSFSDPDFTAPLFTLYTVEDDYDFTDPTCAGNEFICWPTVAPSSLVYYGENPLDLPGWGPALLFPSLKSGAVYRVRLSQDGLHTEGSEQALFETTNRYRDVAVGADRRTFYVLTDSDGSTSGPTSGSTQELANRGAVLAFRYASGPTSSL